MFQKLPAGPACERCAARSYVSRIEPHPTKAKHTIYTFECPRCYHLMRVTVAPRKHTIDSVARVGQFVLNAELLVERQQRLVRRLQHQDRDVTRAEALLEVMQDSLDALRRYHDYVVRYHGSASSNAPEEGA